MFNKVLIANRGAIAVRIIRTLKKLNCESVVLYSEADRDSLHVAQADHAYSLGEGNTAATYLDQDKIIAIAKESGAKAIHPGYGFLSENAEFAERCKQENIIFLGPRPEHIIEFGLKHKARQLAKESAVPLLPGSELLSTLDEALETAAEIGYPVMLKTTAGGGGIGMSTCANPSELKQAYDSVKRLGQNNFSNNGVFLEKFIANARHIEVQVFGDGKGNAITLGERDCSAQRRNQKVIEETPAPNIPDDIRQQLAATARSLVTHTQYQSAGTVEFIYDSDTNLFYFLEVNTRLQVEHGVTEQIYDIDLVEWMIKLGARELPELAELENNLKAKGHSIQIRLYAEDANKNFQPSSGLLSQVFFPEEKNIRIDHWIEAGLTVSPYYDPMLAKVIATGADRNEALTKLKQALNEIRVYGIETNLNYVGSILNEPIFKAGKITTRYLNQFTYKPHSIDVLSSGTQTTIQDYPGRQGYWHVGIPPSGPFDSVSFRLGNQLLGNPENVAGLEITLQGPILKFNQATHIVLTGAQTDATITRNNGVADELEFWKIISILPGDQINTGKTIEAGSRAYLLVSGGIQCPEYLDSKSTFTLGQFGGHAGRSLRTGDVIHFLPEDNFKTTSLIIDNPPTIKNTWQLRVIYGPHGAPDFFTPADIDTFFAANWEVHYNSSRTGIRLIGPKPDWARSDGGEAGMHPSNIHDNAYAIGAIDFTGDMPVILGPDGPSLGGFVCPATVITADLWKLGQLKAGDKIQFIPVSIDDAVQAEKDQQQSISSIQYTEKTLATYLPESCLLKTLPAKDSEVTPGKRLPKVVYRPQGDHYLLVEYGPLKLDIELRFRAHALMLWLEKNSLPGIRELTPGVRSLQIHYNSQELSLDNLLSHLEKAEDDLDHDSNPEVEARIVHIPLSWDDEACRIAIEKYTQSVRKDAPWCPSNIEFIRRINGLNTIEDVKKIVFDAHYLVLGLGDVYLGAPVATPIDPRHRLVTTKYNPARTWTAENSVGIGGSYLCVYGMEGPGGYQFVGRTLQMWNRYHQTSEFSQPWLLRFFDQIRFYEVSAEELVKIRQDFLKGGYPLKIEQTRFNLNEYQEFLQKEKNSIDEFTSRRDQAFDAELQRWIESGQINFDSSAPENTSDTELDIPEGGWVVDSHIAGNIWQVLVEDGQQVEAGETLLVIESMKMEIEVTTPQAGKVTQILKQQGDQVSAGQTLLVLTD